METLQLLGVALGMATLAGVNLYLTVFVTGLAIRFEWITLASQYQQLDILAHPAILILAGTLYFIEFFADKIPWVDSLWDSVHTVLRPVGGMLIAIQVLGDSNAVFEVAVALLAGGMSLVAHSIKAGTRVVVNGSPEPFSNIAVSVTEDVGVLGGLWLLYLDPVVALIVFLAFIATAAWFAPKIFRAVRLKLWLVWKKLNLPADGPDDTPLKDRLPADEDILYAALEPGGTPPAWGARCVVAKGRRFPTGRFGYLAVPRDDRPIVHFVARGRLRPVAKSLDLSGHKVAVESKFLSENLVLYRVDDKNSRNVFLFDRPSAGAVRQIAADLERRIGAASQAPVSDAEITVSEAVET